MVGTAYGLFLQKIPIEQIVPLGFFIKYLFSTPHPILLLKEKKIHFPIGANQKLSFS